MKIAAWIAAVFLSLNVYAHGHHAKHNMVLVGDNEIFASHLVYKSPHNFQVILKVGFDAKTKEKFIRARKAKPENLLILLLDEMDISRIASAASLSGTLYTEDPKGVRTELASSVKIGKDDFRLLYFDEVPLSLNPDEVVSQ